MPSKKLRPPKMSHIKPYRFPYTRFHGQGYPLIPVTLTHGNYSVSTFALLDSGASVSVFRPEIAQALRLKLRGRKSIRMGTPIGGINVGMAPVVISVEKTQFKGEVGFSQKFEASFNILGRKGFFSHFSICFDERAQTVFMIPLRSKRR